jgi:hypothetical protein
MGDLHNEIVITYLSRNSYYYIIIGQKPAEEPRNPTQRTPKSPQILPHPRTAEPKSSQFLKAMNLAKTTKTPRKQALRRQAHRDSVVIGTRPVVAGEE